MEQTIKMLNEGFLRKYLRESEDVEEEKDEIEVGDLFTNGDETYELLDVKIDENGDVVVEAENKESGEPEDIEYISKEEAEEMYGEYNPEDEPEEEELTDLTVECINKRKFMEKFSSLRNLNEAQMSDEDRADSEILRKILINKYRPSDRLNKKELAVLDKYGLTRDANRGRAYVYDADGNVLAMSNRGYTNPKVRDGRVNLADRARKMSGRNDHSDIDDYGHFAWDGPIGKNSVRYKDIKTDRAIQNYKLQKNYNQMKDNIRRRDFAKDDLDFVDSRFDREEARLRKELDNLKKRREDSRNYYSSKLNDEQSKIDKMLRKKRGTSTVATESISDNATKSEFIKAYKWAYGATNAEAQKAFREFDEKAKQEIIKGFKQNAKKSFLSDGLHRSNSKGRRLKENNFDDSIKYYEVEFGKYNDTGELSDDTYSVCIKATHEPSLEEAEKFCMEDINNMGYDTVISVDEIPYELAKKFYDMENESAFPILEARNPRYYAESIRRNSKKIRGLKESNFDDSYKEYILHALEDSGYPGWARKYSNYDFYGTQPWMDGTYNVVVDDSMHEVRIPTSMDIDEIISELTSDGYRESYY